MPRLHPVPLLLAAAILHALSSPSSAATAAPAQGVAAEAQTLRTRYIVSFDDAPLARYQGESGKPPAPSVRWDGRGRKRLDVHGAEARAYVDYLQSRQALQIAAIEAALGLPLQVEHRMQHALNAIVVQLNEAEAQAVARLPGVLGVEADVLLEQATDVGPTLIGAPIVWAGSPQLFASGFEDGERPVASQPAARGEGTVIGIIDSGINFGSPSFASVDPVDAYAHVNPLGANVLGTCQPGGVDQGRCNDKLIGGYDFVCAAPANQCGLANVREEPGFGDTNGHGSHVASTAAGNRRDVEFNGAPLRISGVAPRANIVAFDVCYTNTSTGQGLCPGSSSAAAINQAIADGVVDALNFSISGGSNPWGESVSQAFLSATAAGIVVVAAAGNSGPGAATTSHVQPWTTTVAAAQHGRENFAITLSATGPAPVPAGVVGLFGNQSTGGAQFTATLPATTPLVISPGIDTVDDGCNAFPATPFAGAIALVRRGTCNFTVKVGNAAAAGAVAVIIANNQAGSLIPSTPASTIPALAITQANGNALRDFGQAHPGLATAEIQFPPVAIPNVADALAGFSSRGPTPAGFDLIKPDLTAPGVQVLAALAGTSLTGSENLIGFNSGTSMASPHVAGAALLVRQRQPAWTAMEVKSALAMTSSASVLLEDLLTAADPHAGGSGRVQVDRAVNAGLVLDESQANLQAANPGAGGNPAQLNLASLADASCAGGCSFSRTLRSTRSEASNWRVTLSGLGGTVPPTLSVPAGGTVQLTVDIDVNGLPADGLWKFGRIELVELDAQGEPRIETRLHLPVGVVVPQ